MKKNQLVIIALLSGLPLLSQAQNSNPWPSTGNVGIGTTTPGTRVLNVYTAGTDVAMEATNAYSTGSKYAVRGIVSGTGDTNTGLFTTADGATSNYGLRIYNIPSATNNFAIYSDSYAKSYFLGNVGIGTTNPLSLLHVKGISNSLSGSRNAIILDNANTSGNRSNDIILATNGVAKWELANDIGANGNQDFYIYDDENGAARFFINSTGKIGIGTTSPDEKLTVYGKIHSQEVKVELSVPGPDYVFEPTYKLPTLAEIKTFVDKNHHLPEIPTATEMAKNGIDLGEMNTKLLKKVEELTLYLIQQKDEKDKQIAELNQQIKELKNKIH